MIAYVYKRCLNILMSKPLMLWGLSLLSSVLTVLCVLLCWLPIICIPINLVLNAGVSMIYLDGYKGKTVNSDQLFKGFTNFWHVAGGMAWRKLWLFLWGMISSACIVVIMTTAGVFSALSFLDRYNYYLFSTYGVYGGYTHQSYNFSAGTILICLVAAVAAIVGIIIYYIKNYSYCFTPYILMEHPEYSATEALRVSMKETKGFRGTLFISDLICIICLIIFDIFCILLSMIPGIGFLFTIIMILVQITAPLFLGLVHAGFYVEITGIPPQQRQKQAAPYEQQFQRNPQQNYQTSPNEESIINNAVVLTKEVPVKEILDKTPNSLAVSYCTQCGTTIEKGQRFCTKCGKELEQ